jgi:HK97 gp10 family phage protein
MNGVQIKLTGVKEIDEVFNKLPLALQDRVLQQAHREAAKPLIAKAKALAPKDKGNLFQSIGVQTGGFNQVKSLQREVGAVKVGPRRGKYKGGHAHLIEYGTMGRYTKGKGKVKKYKNAYRGMVRKKPFMEPAFQATKSQLINISAEHYAKPIRNLMRRTLKK